MILLYEEAKTCCYGERPTTTVSFLGKSHPALAKNARLGWGTQISGQTSPPLLTRRSRGFLGPATALAQFHCLRGSVPDCCLPRARAHCGHSSRRTKAPRCLLARRREPQFRWKRVLRNLQYCWPAERRRKEPGGLAPFCVGLPVPHS